MGKGKRQMLLYCYYCCYGNTKLFTILQDPKLWYGIGILYDRYGSLEHAEEAFSAVMKMDPKFEKANEIYFRLGIIYKQQQKFELSLQVHFLLFIFLRSCSCFFCFFMSLVINLYI